MRLPLWVKPLMLFLWITPHVLLGVIAVALYRRRWHREFPCFFVYLFWEMAAFVLTFALYVDGATKAQYGYAHYVTMMGSTVLRFGIIDEVSQDLFRNSKFLKPARRALRGIAGLLLIVAVTLAIYSPQPSSAKWFSGVTVMDRGASLVQAGMLLLLWSFSHFLGLPWRRPAFGIMLGLGVFATIELAVQAVTATLSNLAWMHYLDLITTGNYLICVLIWIRYAWVPESNPASVAIVSHEEVETWNTELQHLLKD